MTRTQRRTLPSLLATAGAVLLAGVGVLALTGPGDDLPATATHRCASRTVEVEFGAILGDRERPVKIMYWANTGELEALKVTAKTWLTVDPALPCPATAQLNVNAADVWGGDTECWIAVNGERLVERHTRRREECAVTVRLVI